MTTATTKLPLQPQSYKILTGSDKIRPVLDSIDSCQTLPEDKDGTK